MHIYQGASLKYTLGLVQDSKDARNSPPKGDKFLTSAFTF